MFKILFLGGIKFNRKALLAIDGLFSLLDFIQGLKKFKRNETLGDVSSVIFWSTLACIHRLVHASCPT
jgi:hypothetical protein